GDGGGALQFGFHSPASNLIVTRAGRACPPSACPPSASSPWQCLSRPCGPFPAAAWRLGGGGAPPAVAAAPQARAARRVRALAREPVPPRAPGVPLFLAALRLVPPVPGARRARAARRVPRLALGARRVRGARGVLRAGVAGASASGAWRGWGGGGVRVRE